LWISSNYGASFSEATSTLISGTFHEYQIAIDYTGQYQVAVTINFGPIARIYYSVNYGVTWAISASLQGVSLWGVAISANAQYLTIPVAGGYIYTWSNPTALNVYGNANVTQTLTANSIRGITVSAGNPITSTFYVVACETNASYGSTLTMNYSYDLTTWTPVKTSFNAITYYVKNLNGVYFALGFNNNNQTTLTPILRSVDGINWAKPTSIPVEGNNELTFSNILYANNLYIAVGRNGCQGYIWRSTDGQTWTDSTTAATTGIFFPDPGCGSTTVSDVAYGNGRWVVIGTARNGGGNTIGTYYSTDGITFLFSTNQPSSTIIPLSVDFDGSKFVMVGLGTGVAAWRWSSDGITWDTSGFSGDTTWASGRGTCITFNGTMWLACSYIGVGEVKYSYDGLAWTNLPAGGLVSGAKYRRFSWDGSRWFVSLASATASFAYSYDGFNWIPISIPSINTTTNASNSGNYVSAVQQPIATLNVNGSANISQNLIVNAINTPLYGYSLVANGSQINTKASDSGRTFLLDIANSQSSIVWLPSTSLISQGWTCKVVNMNTTGSGSFTEGKIFVSSPQALQYQQYSGGRLSVPYTNVNGGSSQYSYYKYATIVFDGTSFYAIS